MELLYSLHERALTVVFSDVANAARTLDKTFIGTPGSVIQRSNKTETQFYVHQFYDGERKQRERYLAGPVGSPDAEAAAEALRVRIAEANDLVPSLRMLGREGYNLANPLTFATVATLFNHDVFHAGGVLIGSHAYGMLLNQLGARAASYQTEDDDSARHQRLAFAEPPGVDFLELIRESGIDFVAVPAFKRGQPSSSFKKKGKARFQVELLVPSAGEDCATVPVPELGAHATALPYLGYLLRQTQWAPMLSRVGCCLVRVPLPEHFATHKLIVSQLRTNRAKAPKDLHRACVLGAYLADEHPGALSDAVAEVPVSARKHLRRGLDAARQTLEASAPAAWVEWSDSVS